jgi:putative flippase GtrA
VTLPARARTLAARLLQWRFVRFGTIGASGTAVNQALLYFGQHWLFRGIVQPTVRLNCSMALAILVATINNFSWNRRWTWPDRARRAGHSLLTQFGQYALACWVGIVLQFLLTNLLVLYFHYLLANLIAIGCASVCNFAVNDLWTFRHRHAVLTAPRPDSNGWAMRSPAAPLRHTLYALAAVLACTVYCFQLDSQHIPKNGDEDPYFHITRLTALAGHWLPLQSDLGMRDTKPPLLFWQGMVSTDQARHWTLWNLRYPSVLYSLLTATMAFLLGRRFAQSAATGVLAALVYLAFFSTYHYGRPFLTNAPETFWLFLAWFIPLFWPQAMLRSRALPLLLGAIIGVGLLYKSFALLLPVGLALSWWFLHQRAYRWRDFLRQDVWRLALIAAVALALFSLWFVLDPDPRSVWQSFVLKENVGKFAPAGGSYFARLLWGGSSLWTMLLGAPLNAGLLALPVAALMLSAWRGRAALSAPERLLWIWVLSLILVFSLPSQRSARYLLDAMPAVAVLCALGWDRLGRGWFIAALALGVLGLAFLGFEALVLQHANGGVLYAPWYWLLLLAAAALSVLAILLPWLTRPATAVASLLVFGALAAFLQPFDDEFSARAQPWVAGREVWVPSDFASSLETYRFLLPGADVHTYLETREQDPEVMARQYPLFALRVPLGSPPCNGCRVLARRLDVRGRLTSAETGALLHGRGVERVFLQELLVASPAAAPP